MLTAYWITTSYKWGPLGYGVTAHSRDDAIRIIEGWGYELPESPTVREGVTVAELDQQHIVPNMGPIVVRGLWYPFRGIGVPGWMDG